MDVITAIQTEQIPMGFVERPVPDEMIREVIRAGHQAQIVSGTRDWRFIAVRDLDTLRALSVYSRFSGHIAEAAFIVVPVANQVYPFEKGQIIAYMRLAAWGMGIASCLAPILNVDGFREILEVPYPLILDTAISFGWLPNSPNGNLGKNLVSIDDAIRWEHW